MGRDAKLIRILVSVELPTIKINEENGQAESDTKKTRGIQVCTQPVATSFAVFEE